MENENKFAPNKVTMSINGVDIDPVPESIGQRRVPWYTITIPNGTHVKYRNDYKKIDATDKNGVSVSFYLKNGSEDLNKILECDPFGENQLELIKENDHED